MAAATGIHPFMYVLLGCPGSGKGTFAQAMKAEGYAHLSTGDITREEVKQGTEFGLKYKDAILNHVIGGIPFEEIQALVDQRLEKAVKEQKGLVLDGYPKTLEQCVLLDGFIQRNALEGRIVFLMIAAKEEDVVDRILCRQTCDKCGKIYNSKFSPSKVLNTCDVCEGELTGRMDDNSAGTIKRVYEFKEKMQPVIQYYEGSSRLTVVDGNGSPVECLERFLALHRLQTIGRV